jgi:hypothetical protein
VKKHCKISLKRSGESVKFEKMALKSQKEGDNKTNIKIKTFSFGVFFVIRQSHLKPL